MKYRVIEKIQLILYATTWMSLLSITLIRSWTQE